MRGSVHDSRVCALGKGPLWHPEREQIFWFDTLGKRLLTREGDAGKSWEFSTITATAGWVNRDTLLIAAVAELFAFSLTTGHRAHVAALEPDTRPNAGRADPWGGFWIGTTGHEPQAGAIYRFHQGRLTRLFDGLTAANGICFSPDRAFAYFADTPTRQILRQRLDADGWPDGHPTIFVDLTAERLNPGGAVVDAEGCLWSAQWGANRVAQYGSEGSYLGAVSFAATNTSCPAFGGPDLRTLFCTSATEGTHFHTPSDGCLFTAQTTATGQPEHRVIL